MGELLRVVRRDAVLTLLASVSLASAGYATATQDAERLLAEGQRAAAATLLRDALPTLPSAEVAHATFLLANLTDRWSEADSLYARVLDRHRGTPWAPRALVELGEHALLGGEVQSAQRYFDEAALLAPVGPVREKALLRDSQALLLMGQPGEARLRINQLLEESTSPELTERARLLLAACAHHEGDFAEALRVNLDLIGEGRPLEAPALLGAARALLARGEGTLALEYLRQLSREYPATPDGAVARALADSLALRVPAPAPPGVDTLDVGPAPSFDSTRPAAGRPAGDMTTVPGAVDVPSETPRTADGTIPGPAASGAAGGDVSDPAAPDVGVPPERGAATGPDAPAVDPYAADYEDAEAPAPGSPRADAGQAPGGADAVGAEAGGMPEGDGAAGDAEPSRDDEPGGVAGAATDGAPGFYVQLGAFANRIGALSTVSELRRKGIDGAEIERVESDGRRVYRVRVGPYRTRGAARADQPRLEEAAGVQGSFVREAAR